jgi:hypothetical protein
MALAQLVSVALNMAIQHPELVDELLEALNKYAHSKDTEQGLPTSNDDQRAAMREIVYRWIRTNIDGKLLP